MTPKTIRLLAGFLAGFILLSLAPELPGFIAGLDDGRGLELPAISNATLIAIGGCVALLGLMVAHRRQRLARMQPRVRPASNYAVARPSVEQPLRRATPEHSGPYPTIPSPLQIRLRAAVEKGERIPVLARKHSISIDAVRTAVGATATSSTPAARTSTSFRGATPSLPPRPRSRPVPQGRTRYQTTV